MSEQGLILHLPFCYSLQERAKNGVYVASSQNVSFSPGGLNCSNTNVVTNNVTIPNDYTVALWFVPKTIATGGTLVGVEGWEFDLSTNSGYQVRAYSNGGLLANLQLSANVRYHTAVTRNSAGTCIYMNGCLTASNTSTYTLPVNVPITVGAWKVSSQYISAVIQGLKIYNRALTASQILREYNGLAKDKSNV